jgi:hypothetical protein
MAEMNFSREEVIEILKYNRVPEDMEISEIVDVYFPPKDNAD